MSLADGGQALTENENGSHTSQELTRTPYSKSDKFAVDKVFEVLFLRYAALVFASFGQAMYFETLASGGFQACPTYLHLV